MCFVIGEYHFLKNKMIFSSNESVPQSILRATLTSLFIGAACRHHDARCQSIRRALGASSITEPATKSPLSTKVRQTPGEAPAPIFTFASASPSMPHAFVTIKWWDPSAISMKLLS
ncbi:MAG: hypothetical protein IPP37_14220 [Saprospiraceae bacterium]|nr:hypothetical protein [Saprospiraceae bacterium]